MTLHKFHAIEIQVASQRISMHMYVCMYASASVCILNTLLC